MKFRSHEIGTLNCRIALKFDRHIGSNAAEVPVKFQSDRTILNTNLAASRLYGILRKDVFSDIETGLWSLWSCWIISHYCTQSNKRSLQTRHFNSKVETLVFVSGKANFVYKESRMVISINVWKGRTVWISRYLWGWIDNYISWSLIHAPENLLVVLKCSNIVVTFIGYIYNGASNQHQNIIWDPFSNMH